MLSLKKKQDGFSLLEVLVAFSIFALSLGVIFQIYGTGSRSTILSDEYARAVIIAQSKLVSIGIDKLDNLGEFSGIENNKFRWVTRINHTAYDDSNLETNFKLVKRLVEVEVNWDSMGKTRSFQLNTMKLIPVL